MLAAHRCVLLWLALALSCWASATPAQTIRVVPAFALYSGEPGALTPTQFPSVAALIDAYDFDPLQGRRNLGYTRQEHWGLIDLTRLPAAWRPASQALWLEYGYPAADEVDVYGGSASGWQLLGKAGDIRPWNARQRYGPNFYFSIPESSTHLLVRVRTQGSTQFPLALYSASGLQRHLFNQAMIDGLLFGALGIMVLYNLFIYLMMRDRVYLYYVLLISAVTLTQFTLSGYGTMYLWRSDPVWMSVHILPISVGLCLMFVALFTRRILGIPGFSPLFNRLLLLEFILSGALLAAGLVTAGQWLMQATALWPIVVVLTSLLAGLWAAFRQQPAAGLFLGGWGGGLLGAAVFAAQQHGWLPLNPVTANSLKAGVLLTALLLSFSLASHIRKLREERASFEREARENYALALVDGLTGVPNRRAFDERLGNEINRCRRDKRSIALLMVDIDYFKNFNDAYGHQQGDDTLVRTALIMRKCLRRPSDALFRYGGEEFSIVLPDTDLEGAQHTARRVMAAIERLAVPHQASPFKQVTVSIGGTVARNASIEMEDFIQLADQALYQAKHRGRNSLVMVEERENPVVNIGDYFKNTPKDTL
ncbi:MAG: hypothetical protein CML06_19755 [Pseudomonadales bacterium]|nr:hypothetical protein [Pseudomonadales bacterium]